MLVEIIRVAFRLLEILLIIRILLSWINHDPNNAVIKFIYDITEPILAPFRRIIPPIAMIDFSPIVAFFALDIVKSLLITLVTKI